MTTRGRNSTEQILFYNFPSQGLNGELKGVPKMIIQKTKAYLALQYTIEASLCNRRPICNGSPKVFDSLSKKSYLKEYGTIKFSLPRMSGHTINSLELLPKYFTNILWLCFNVGQERGLENYNCSNIEISTVSSFLNSNNNIEFLYNNCIVVDTASLLNDTKIHRIYDKICDADFDEKFTLIFLE